MEDVLSVTDKIIDARGADPEALVEILKEVNDTSGHLTREHLQRIAKRMDMPLSKVYSVASFYSLLSLKQLGKHVIRFCQDAPCHVVGGREVWDALEQGLGISFGETTPDGEWSLLTTSCIGACAVGPVMMIDDDIYGNLTPQKVDEILARYRDTAAQGGEA